mgnify:CR=1 FL=1
MIAVTVKNNTLNSEIENCFGKAKYFYLFDEASGNSEFCLNPGYDLESGAGSKAVKFLVSKGVQTLISINIGIKAKKLLDEKKVQIVIVPLKYRLLFQLTRFFNSSVNEKIDK